MYKTSVYPIMTKRKSIDLSCFGMGRFRIVGTRQSNHGHHPVVVIQVKLDSWKRAMLAEMGVLAI
jgi:hypothetical protein